MNAPERAGTTPPNYEPFGWHHWPDHFFMSYQFRRGLGETQEGGGAVSECFQAASRMIPGDLDSWHKEWMVVAERNDRRGDDAERAGHIRTAMNCWLRAADYFRSAEFWLAPDDPRRLPTFTRCEAASKKWLRHLDPPGEAVEIPYEDGKTLPAYFIKSSSGGGKQPVLISFGGLDSFKDELWFMTGHGAVQRGIAVLLVDGPGQGGALRRQNIVSRHDYEVPVGRCIDWLETRADIDSSAIGIWGVSLGGYFAPRAAAFEKRLKACVALSGPFQRSASFEGRPVINVEAFRVRAKCANLEEAGKVALRMTLAECAKNITCPIYIVAGTKDRLTSHTAAEQLAAAVSGPCVLSVIEGGNHVVNNLWYRYRDQTADWMAAQLGAAKR